MSQQKRAHTDAGAETEPVPKEQRLNVQEIEDSDEPDEPDEPDKHSGELAEPEPYVMVRVSWLGADGVSLRWGDEIWFVPEENVKKNVPLAPAVHKAEAARKGDDKMWKLRFATEGTDLPREEDSRTVLNLQIEDDDIMDSIGFGNATDQFDCGKIVGQIHINTTM